jgi:ADP-ribose pyrophosphatase
LISKWKSSVENRFYFRYQQEGLSTMSFQIELARTRVEKYIDLMETRPDLFLMDNILRDADEMMAFAIDNEREVGLVYASPWHYLLVDVVLDIYDKPAYTYERYVNVAEQAGCVIVPVLPDERICLLEHYRHTIGMTVLELPRGFAEKGENEWQAAIRELTEEMGVKALSSKILGKVIPDSGVNGTPITIIISKIEDVSANIGHEGICGVLAVSPMELDQMVVEDKIVDGFTLSALAMLKAANSNVWLD